MTTQIRFRRGFKNDLPPSAPSGMPLWCEDTKELYLGTGTGIVQVTGQSITSSNGKQPFEIFYSFSTETPAGAYPLWTGELIPNCRELIPAFWNKALALSKEQDVFVQLLTPMSAALNSQYEVSDLQEIEGADPSYLAIAEPNSYAYYPDIKEFPVGAKITFNTAQTAGTYVFSFSTTGSKRPDKIAPPTSVEVTLTKETGEEVSVWSTSDIPQELNANRVISGKVTIDYTFKSASFKITGANSNEDIFEATLSNCQIEKIMNTLPPRIRAVTQDVYDTEVSTYLETGAFVIDEAAGSIRLPKVTRFIASIEQLSQIGTAHNDQILEHTHTYRTDNKNRPRGDDRTACFTYDAEYQTSGVNGARKGNENLVKHIKVGLFIQVYNSVINESVLDVAKFNNTLLTHTHPKDPQYFVNCGIQTGQTTYVYPPQGYTMSNLHAFIPSPNTIHFAGTVDYNDSLYCTWSKDDSKITVTCYNSEQRANPNVNWLAVWRK